ncbi:MAG: peptidoglycan DD-metalloendopeptidase family protein [Rhodocyclaceae bacterium]|nr:peptidoglycan DD-metalloendopeptidase family protein [Rhodocyclaceae bacterium]
MNRLLLSVALTALLSACANHPPAPVIDRGTSGPARAAATAESRPGFYTVKKGDTLYSIALDHGQPYRDVAAWNNIENPNVIRVGQSLRIAPPQDEGGGVVTPIRTTDVETVKPVANAPAAPVAAGAAASLKQEPKGGKQPYSDEAWARAQQPAAVPAAKPAEAAAAAEKPAEKPAETPAVAGAEEVTDWVWPTTGKVGTPFAEGSSKGIDIPAKAGQPVLAASGGTVTLVSSAVRGYGNLVVIKHSQTLLSVYAHNSKVLVEEKQTVAKGQKIAEVGATDTDSPKLHFEIRRMGKPVDPLKFLPPR